MNQTVVSSMMSVSPPLSRRRRGGRPRPGRRGRRAPRSLGAPARDEPQQQLDLDDGQRGVQQGEDDQRGPHLAGGHVRGDAVAVVMTPKTSHGWRPVSVKIQPKLLANNGSSGRTATAQNHRPVAGIRSAAGRPQHGDGDQGAQHPEPDHDPEGPVGQRDGRRVALAEHASAASAPYCFSYAALMSLMPSTGPSKRPVARKLSRPGTLTANVSRCRPASRSSTARTAHGCSEL